MVRTPWRCYTILMALAAAAPAAAKDAQKLSTPAANAAIRPDAGAPAAVSPTPQPAGPQSGQWPRLLEKSPSQPQPAWPEADVKAAREACAAVLAGSDVVAVPVEPIREGECGAPAPVMLISVGRNPQVTLSTPATVTCELAAALDRWVKSDVQPAARELLGAPVIRIEVMSAYSCRAAYGRKNNRMSEHGRANALDVAAFLTEKAGGVELLADWGPTDRDIRAHAAAAAAAGKAAARSEANKKPAESAAAVAGQSPAPPAGPGAGSAAEPDGAPAQAAALRGPVVEPDGALGLSSGAHSWRQPPPVLSLTPPARLGGPKAAEQSAPVRHEAPARGATAIAKEGAGPTRAASAKARFLRRLHASACKAFGTILGPEANEAHRNHFHIDLAERKGGSYCE